MDDRIGHDDRIAALFIVAKTVSDSDLDTEVKSMAEIEQVAVIGCARDIVVVIRAGTCLTIVLQMLVVDILPANTRIEFGRELGWLCSAKDTGEQRSAALQCAPYAKAAASTEAAIAARSTTNATIPRARGLCGLFIGAYTGKRSMSVTRTQHAEIIQREAGQFAPWRSRRNLS